MLNLSFDNLKNIQSPGFILPDKSLFQLPEKILQFGTGVLLRGLPDYFIDKANRNGIFNGRVIAIKSTGKGPSDAFNKQQGLYTLAIRGIENNKRVETNIICSSLNRVLPASTSWADVMNCAHNPELKIIISNTTEAGIQFNEENISGHVPESFPGKLLAFLYQRYETFKESKSCGMVIVPTELVPENGRRLKEILKKLAAYNKLGNKFTDWLEHENYFCNSLVDRIVPGKPDEAFIKAFKTTSGYHDELLITAEPYCLWAIEGDAHIASVLSFSEADKRMIITPDINRYREIKLRLLNGSHTLSCGIGFLAGIQTVKETMDNSRIAAYIRELMLDEIIPAIPYPVEKEEAADFAQKTLDRFRNPYIRHQWLDITKQYSMKMRMRVVPLLLRHYELYHTIPRRIAFGFAAYLLFMKITKQEGSRYFGKNEGMEYPVTDDQAAYFYEQWKLYHVDTERLTEEILKNASLWDADLTALPGFAEAVKEQVKKIRRHGMLTALEKQEW